MDEQLERAIHAAKNGHREVARSLLLEVLKVDPDNETAWLWMAGVVEGERRQQALERVLEINPKNATAQRELEKLQYTAPPQFEDTRTCPYCAETIKAAATVCRFCGRDLVATPRPAPVAPAIPAKKQGSKALNLLGCAILSVFLVCGGMTAIALLGADAVDLPEQSYTPRGPVNPASYRAIDVRELDSYTDRYRGDLVKLEGEVFNIMDDGLQFQVREPGGDEWDTVPVGVTWDYDDILPAGVYEDTVITVYGRVKGTFSGTNAFGAEISQPLIVADRIVKQP